MADTQKDLLITWLNDAYAMENAVAQILTRQVDDFSNRPQVQDRLKQHLNATHQHAEQVKGLIESKGGSTSSIKSGMASMMGAMQGMSTGAAGDTQVKDVLAGSAVEQFEIASYRALIFAADQLNDQETVRVCRDILGSEEAMAGFLAQQEPSIVQATFLSAGQPAS